MNTMNNQIPRLHTHLKKFLKGTNLEVEVIALAHTPQYLDKIAIIWFDWKPTNEILKMFIQYRTPEESIMEYGPSCHCAALTAEYLMDGPTEQPIGVTLYA